MPPEARSPLIYRHRCRWEATLEAKPPAKARSGISTRIDPAHATASTPIPTAPGPTRAQLAILAGAATPSLDPTVIDQVQRQSAELGERLQQRQRELDRREATFQAQVAQLENELRSARLLQQELQHELLDRQRSVARREEQLDRETADLLHAESTQLAEASQQSAVASQLNADAKLTAEQWRRRIAELDRGERQLKSQLADVAFKQQTLDQQREQLMEEYAQREQRQRDQRESDTKRLDAELVRLRTRQEEVERRAISVRQLHHDTCQTYRETIELRIATEQIWAEMSGKISTAELTRRLATWRKKLMDQYALASESLEQQKSENLTLLHRLEEQAESLKRTRDELRQWMSRRQQELIEEADKLLSRERELDREQANMRHLEQQWSDQKASYEQEIRRLRRLAQT